VLDPKTSRPVTDSNEKAVVVGQSFRSVISQLNKTGAKVVLLHSAPHFRPWALPSCPTWRILAVPQTCAPTMTEDEFARTYGPERNLETQAAQGLATAVDVADLVCPEKRCAPYRNGRWVYRDAGHLTTFGASLLTERVAKTFQSLRTK
jgi:SGNH domain (fused to AT3 domains)